MELPEKLKGAIEGLSKIPGVGQKTALRQALALLNWNEQEIKSLSYSIEQLTKLGVCEVCSMLCDDKKCIICSTEDRIQSETLCVVESITDCIAIENSNTFSGKYHVLGGVLNPLLGVGPDELGLDKLFKRISIESVKSIILAVNPSVEGDATCSYIKQNISDEVEVDRIGFGIPIGGSLEYLDSLTISKALENRKKM
ncbi:recombination mediator RecR [Bacteriovoracaceae bacterium]|nr:recombination mediator RecR [Bacteriovoracaceae bacterium]|tara:strand:+ start:165950 stop:166543 length:594 start_codon:yes stop_codon:yes gene_type:complete